MSSEINTPTVSVILPFFNAEKTLSRAVESILNQTFSDFELLLVANNSNDTSTEIALKLAKTDSRIFLLSEKIQGVAHAMNCGLKHARGRYIARMDADDFSLPHRLEKQLEFLKANPEIGVVGTAVHYISHSKKTKGFRRFVDWSNSFYSSRDIELNRFVELPIVNPTLCFRKEVYEKYGGCVQGNFPEDYEMQLRYLQAGVKMAKLPESLLEWHDSETRLTRTDVRYSTDAFFKIKAFYFAKWSEQNNAFHPNVHIWGAGRKTRQRAKLLKTEGLKIEGFIDVVESKPKP